MEPQGSSPIGGREAALGQESAPDSVGSGFPAVDIHKTQSAGRI